jgi:V-type H+-transporting ATPase subunit H
VLKSCQNKAQLAYELIFVLWALSFCEDAYEKFSVSGALDVLIQQVVVASREKVVRVALETLQVLLEY